MASGKHSLLSIAFVLLLINFDDTSRQYGVHAADMFIFTASNNLRDPKFTATANIPIDGRPLVRYLEDLVLMNTLNFRSFVTNFTSFGSFVVAINGVRTTYPTDKAYWEFFVNHQAYGKGISFYQPQANDIAELRFVQDHEENPY